jgi:hypothetical protein
MVELMSICYREHDIEVLPWPQFQPWLDACLPSPTRDVWRRVVECGRHLLQRLLPDNAGTAPVVASLTTRVPQGYLSLGLRSCGQSADGSTGLRVPLP